MIVDIIIPARNPDSGLGDRILALAGMLDTIPIGAIIVVDDGSDRPVASALAGLHSPVPLRFVRLDGPGNRSAARNAGARTATATATHLFFLDSDCVPATPALLANLAASFAPGVAVAGGPVCGVGRGFWHRYQEHIVAERNARGAMSALTSANLLVARAAFDSVGGFDEGYTRYGFEDRDLILRLATAGTAVFRTDAVMEHRDRLSMRAVSRKMYEAGRGSSARFHDQHPAIYAASGYARMDVALRPWLRPVAASVAPLALCAAPWLDRVIDAPVPFWIMRRAVKLIGALAFLYGTFKRSSDA